MNIRLIFLGLLISGCSTTPPVNEALGQDAISAITMSCKNPYVLTQDCSIWSGATRELKIEGFVVKVAGSDDGKIIFVMDSDIIYNAIKEMAVPNFNATLRFTPQPTYEIKVEDYQSVAANNSFVAVQKVLAKEGITIKRVRPVSTMGKIYGYVLELQSDGYSALAAYNAAR